MSLPPERLSGRRDIRGATAKHDLCRPVGLRRIREWLRAWNTSTHTAVLAILVAVIARRAAGATAQFQSQTHEAAQGENRANLIILTAPMHGWALGNGATEIAFYVIPPCWCGGTGQEPEASQGTEEEMRCVREAGACAISVAVQLDGQVITQVELNQENGFAYSGLLESLEDGQNTVTIVPLSHPDAASVSATFTVGISVLESSAYFAMLDQMQAEESARVGDKNEQGSTCGWQHAASRTERDPAKMRTAAIIYHAGALQAYSPRWIDKCLRSILSQSWESFDIFELDYSGRSAPA
jgi:hypothetical protein